MTSTNPGNGLDAGKTELLTGSLRDLFATATTANGVGRALEQLGWDDVFEADPAAATTILFTEHGRALANSRILDEVILRELAPVLPIASGRRAVLYPDSVEAAPYRFPGPLQGLLMGDLTGIAEVVVPLRCGKTACVAVLPSEALDQSLDAIVGLDPTLRWYRVNGAELSQKVTPIWDANLRWRRAQAAGRRALVAEICGLCTAAVELAASHVRVCHQNGGPPVSFQAVRHPLAEAHLAISSAWASLDAAWQSTASPEQAAWAARIAKIRAGRAQVVMRHAVQGVAEMGLTTEKRLHRYVARAAALDVALGDHASLAVDTRADLRASAAAMNLAQN
ncbi:hypothetical protein GGC64_006094 [Mycobacterium sp. OAS707]|uniref:acyl-CoA dehydrogenase family protein n=1 Tax=Mycobacterium sp. OAS707 TaxID=2663822 RepID=UPI001788E82B|nr:acyl-CoA dehydrogenase family protein [Mycobacterium sp. OAS707]MBE1552007.1 hypothetical protein [Mycobacterium sp. OAS707]